MDNSERLSFGFLDVGCGSKPKGDVNVDFFIRGFNPQTGDQIRGEYMSPKTIKNFVLADATRLPFKDESFNVVFSSHTIEHVHTPLLMLREMCRVARRKVIVQCPNRRGSGAIMPHHVNYLDENWFRQASELLGFKSVQFTRTFEGPITPKLKKTIPHALRSTPPWRILARFERSRWAEKLRVPFDIEIWLRKERNLADSSAKMFFVVVYDKPKIFASCFSSSPYPSPESVISYYNIGNEPLPKLYNREIQKHLEENVWFVFCHQDFILMENLKPLLIGKDSNTIYGPIGARPGETRFFGRIIQTNGTSVGKRLKEDTPVQILDEMCVIVHSEVFRQGLSFDEKFRFHFYGADLCMQAYTVGFDVAAMQLRCQHKSTAIKGDVYSKEYLSTLKEFNKKWERFLPIRPYNRVDGAGKTA